MRSNNRRGKVGKGKRLSTVVVRSTRSKGTKRDRSRKRLKGAVQ